MLQKSKIVILITLSFIVVIVSGLSSQVISSVEILKEEEKRLCKENMRWYLHLIESKGKELLSVATLIASDREIKLFLSLKHWENLHSKLEELFGQIRKENIAEEISVISNGYLQNKWEIGFSKEGPYINACSTIKEGEKISGIVSLTLGMEQLLKEYKKITGKNCGLVLLKETLLRNLSYGDYKKLTEQTIPLEEYLLIASEDTYAEFFQKLSFLPKEGILKTQKGKFLVCSLPIKDNKGNVLGYFFTYEPFFYQSVVFGSLKFTLILYIPVVASLFIGWLFGFGKLVAKLERFFFVLNYFNKFEFSTLDRILQDKDERELIKQIKYAREAGFKKTAFEKSLTDPITGLYSKEAVEKFGMDIINKHLIMGKKVSLLLIDIDNLKRRENLKDFLIKETALILKNSLRNTDFLFRWDNGDFLVILAGTGLNDALKVAENLRRKVELHSYRTERGTLKLTISIGVSEVKEEVLSCEQLVENVKKALYIAKRTGKNRVNHI